MGCDINGNALDKECQAAILICGFKNRTELARKAGLSLSTITNGIRNQRIGDETVEKLKTVGIMPKDYVINNQITLNDLKTKEIKKKYRYKETHSKDGTSNITIRAEVASLLKEYCKRHDMTVTDVVNIAIQEWLKDKEIEEVKNMTKEELQDALIKLQREVVELKRKGKD